MNQFIHFLRFFSLADNGKAVPQNLNLPTDEHAVLPAMPGDFYRVLVPRSDLLGVDFSRIDIRLYNPKTNTLESGRVGVLREQLGAVSSRVRIRVNSAPSEGNYRQFALSALVQNPANPDERISRTLCGTFRGQQTNLTDYVRAIRDFYLSNPYTPVNVSENGNELELTFLHTDDFRLGFSPVSVSLGEVLEYNSNAPALTATLIGSVTLPATDTYNVVVGSDIEEGNTFVCGTKVYTAKSGDTAEMILNALGLLDSKITVNSGVVPSLSVSKGSYALQNNNTPTIQATYTGSGNLYSITIGPDVQPGNIYQVSATGMTTVFRVAGLSDTKTTIEAFFNTGGGVNIPAGQLPTVTALPGTWTYLNDNNPSISLSNKVTTPSQTVDRYTVVVGSSILRGNLFTLGTITVEAEDSDTVLSIASKLGYTGNPFTVEIPTGQALTCYATSGKKYGSDHIADIEVLTGAAWSPNSDLVSEIRIPLNLVSGTYGLVLWDRKTNTTVARSNWLKVGDYHKDDTSMIRFGDEGPVFGFEYAEPGLVQQIRVPVYVGEARLSQEESFYGTYSGAQIRERTTARAVRELVTRAAPEAFHFAMWAALKHRHLWVNGIKFRCEGAYEQTTAVGKKRLMNGTAKLLQESGYWSNYEARQRIEVLSESSGYALIEEIDTPAGLSLWLEKDNVVSSIGAGMSIEPGVYRLFLSGASEELAVAAYVDSRLKWSANVQRFTLNRIDPVLILEAGSWLVIRAVPKTTPETVGLYVNETADDQAAFSQQFSSQFQ